MEVVPVLATVIGHHMKAGVNVAYRTGMLGTIDLAFQTVFTVWEHDHMTYKRVFLVSPKAKSSTFLLPYP